MFSTSVTVVLGVQPDDVGSVIVVVIRDGKFVKPDEIVPTEADPGHDGLCEREQAYFEKAIREDIDLTAHMEDAVNSMRIVAAADRSFREGRTIDL